MLRLHPGDPEQTFSGHALCLGAHCDDLEIGCSGTVLQLAASGRLTEVTWVVFSGDPVRAEEARRSAARLLAGVPKMDVVVHSFRDGFLPAQGPLVKECFEELKTRLSPSIVFTHYRGDLHQDHRLLADLTWNTFRDHLILEYEIPKYDGDFGVPNVFVELDEATVRQKVSNLFESFPSQQGRKWFTEDLFRAVLRLRGMECNAISGMAEAFYGRKLLLS
jgi:LmbE family N-acetylglucosaminyl deacetylase